MMNRAGMVLGALAVVILAMQPRNKIGTLDAAPRLGTVLWSADMESGDLSQWYLPDVTGGPNAGGGVFNSGRATARADVVPHTGKYAANLSIQTPNAPASGTRLFRWKELQTHPQLYYSVWFRFPRRYTPQGLPSWWNVFQWKSRHGVGNDPFFSLNIGTRADGAMYFYLSDQNRQASYDQSLKNIPEGQWFRVEAFYVCAGESTGRVSFWQDGVQIFDIPDVQTRYPDGDCQWSVNSYSNSLSPNPATIFVDDAAICSKGRCP